MKTTKEAVIKATSDLADEKGLNNVSLKAVAQKLNIRTHIITPQNTTSNSYLTNSISILKCFCRKVNK